MLRTREKNSEKSVIILCVYNFVMHFIFQMLSLLLISRRKFVKSIINNLKQYDSRTPVSGKIYRY